LSPFSTTLSTELWNHFPTKFSHDSENESERIERNCEAFLFPGNTYKSRENAGRNKSGAQPPTAASSRPVGPSRYSVLLPITAVTRLLEPTTKRESKRSERSGKCG